MVDYQPIEPKLLDYAAEFLEVHRLLQITVDAKLVTIHQVAFLAGRREHDHRNALGGRSALHFPEHLDAIYFGQLEIEQHQPGQLFGQTPDVFTTGKQKVESLLSISGNMDLVAEFFFAKSVKA